MTGGQPRLTTKASELVSSPEVDAVVVCNATAFHPFHAVLALQNDKHVFVEKPLALCYRDISALSEAENNSKGKLFVGYMRRYAPGFLDAIAEVGEEKIQYVRIRDIIGPNSDFVDQSGTYPKKFIDFDKEDSNELAEKDRDMIEFALKNEFSVPINELTKRFMMILGGLGSHDLSAMREVLGMPKAVRGAMFQLPIWTATFEYDGFPVVYESGINSVPTFDAHIEVYTQNKIIKVNYDTPYIKGLPTTVSIREKTTGPRGETCYQERMIRTTYEDSYTIEFKNWYDCIIKNQHSKTTIADAKYDIDIFKMLMLAAFGTNQKVMGSETNVN